MVEERESRKEGRAVPEQMAPGNITPMMRTSYPPAWYGRFSWGSVLAGALVSIASWLVLAAIGYEIIFSAVPVTSVASLRSVGLGLVVWVAISGAVSWFFGGYAASRFASVQLASDGLWYGIAVWGFTGVIGLALTTIVLPSVITFTVNWISVALGLPNTANLTPTGFRNLVNISRFIGAFIIGAGLLGLAGSVLGAWRGSRRLSEAELTREASGRERMAA